MNNQKNQEIFAQALDIPKEAALTKRIWTSLSEFAQSRICDDFPATRQGASQKSALQKSINSNAGAVGGADSDQQCVSVSDGGGVGVWVPGVDLDAVQLGG